jgi:hypothetical protein
MKFAIIIDKKSGVKAAYEWPNKELMRKIKEKLGEKGVSAFNELIKEFKQESVRIR